MTRCALMSFNLKNISTSMKISQHYFYEAEDYMHKHQIQAFSFISSEFNLIFYLCHEFFSVL